MTITTEGNDFQLTESLPVGIEAVAEGRKPYIRAAPAYSGGILDVAWTYNGERLPVVVDLKTLKFETGLPFVLNHLIDKPLGTIEKIEVTATDLRAEGAFTHDHTAYGQNEILAARKGFKHRPSITVYRPAPNDVVRVGAGDTTVLNERTFRGPIFTVYNGRLRNIALVTTSGDLDADKGSILAHSKGTDYMSTEPNIDNKPVETPNQGTLPPTPPTEDIKASNPSPAPPASTPATPPAPTVVKRDYSETIQKMYERGDLDADIMAQAFDGGWTPAEALRAQGGINITRRGINGQPNVAGFPNHPQKQDGPNGDFIMASAALMNVAGFTGDEVKKYLGVSDDVIHEACAGDLRHMRLHDISAHSVESFHNGAPSRRGRRSKLSWSPQELFEENVKIQQKIDDTFYFQDSLDIRADADTGLSTIGLRNIWAVINTATIGKAYNEQPTTWRSICKIASVSNFLKHTVHRAEFVGDYERLVKAGAEPPHATYSESQTESRVDSWGLMIAFSRQDIINDEIGIFVDAARDLGKKAAKKLDMECYAALLTDGAKIFKAKNKNILTTNSVFSFDALAEARKCFRAQTSPGGERIIATPKILLVPETIYEKVIELLSMESKDGTPKGPININKGLYRVLTSPWLMADNGLYTKIGSDIKEVPGSDTAWYMMADPNDIPTIVATFLNGKTSPSIERANMRFSLAEGIQYRATLDFEMNTGEHRGCVYATGTP